MKRILLLVFTLALLGLPGAALGAPGREQNKNLNYALPPSPMANPYPGTTPLKGEWTSHSRKYDAGGGRYLLDSSIGRLNYQAPWKGVTDWTEANEQWVEAVAPWDWQSTGIDYDVRAKEDLTAGQPIQWEMNGDTVSLTFNNLQWTNDLDQIELISIPQGVATFSVSADRRSIQWEDAYGPGRDLEWQLQSERLMKKLRLETALPTPPQFIIDGGNPQAEISFIFSRSTGLDLWVDGSLWDEKASNPRTTANAVEFRNALGDTVFVFAPPLAWSEAPGVAVDPAVVMRLKQQGPNTFVSVRVPKVWLDTTAYPLVIDATLDLQVGVSGNDGAGTTTGAFSSVATQMASGWVTTAWKSFARFTGVSGLSGATINANTYEDVYYWYSNGSPLTTIYADDSAAPTAPTSWAELNAKTPTTAGVNQDGAVAGDAWTQSASLQSVIQELADSYDPSAIQLLHFDRDGGAGGGNDYYYTRTYDHNTTLAPKIHIDYTTAVGRRIIVIWMSSILFQESVGRLREEAFERS